MPNAHDELAVFLHLVDKLHWRHAAVKGFAELLGGGVQGASKTVPLERTMCTRRQMGGLDRQMGDARLVPTMVRRPDVRLEIRSLPARAHTMVL